MPTWKEQITEAQKLSDDELKRHASVSIDNKHSCRECFTCACVVVRRQNARRFAQWKRAADRLLKHRCYITFAEAGISRQDARRYWESFKGSDDPVPDFVNWFAIKYDLDVRGQGYDW